MVKSVVIICDQSPFGKNSVLESIRLGAGITAVGDIDNCKIIFLGDAVYFLNKDLKPEALNMESFLNFYRMIELADIEIFALDTALEVAGIEHSELLEFDNVNVVSMKDVAQFILEAEATFRY